MTAAFDGLVEGVRCFFLRLSKKFFSTLFANQLNLSQLRATWREAGADVTNCNWKRFVESCRTIKMFQVKTDTCYSDWPAHYGKAFNTLQPLRLTMALLVVIILRTQELYTYSKIQCNLIKIKCKSISYYKCPSATLYGKCTWSLQMEKFLYSNWIGFARFTKRTDAQKARRRAKESESERE